MEVNTTGTSESGNEPRRPAGAGFRLLTADLRRRPARIPGSSLIPASLYGTHDVHVTPSTVTTGVRTTRLLLTAGPVASVVFIGVVLVEGALRPGYEPLHRFGSELALGDRGWVQVANFILTGVCILAFAAGLRRALPTGRGSRAAPVLASLVGVCLIVGGVFVIDPKPGYPVGTTETDEPTLHGLVHDANPLPFYASLVALVCVMAWRFAAEPGGRWWMWFCVIVAILVPVTFGIAAALFDPDTQTGRFHGLWQRVSLAVGLGWFGPVAVHLAARRQDDEQ